MSYAIVYDSRTGNTEALARAVAAALPSEGRLAFGRVDEVDRAAVAQADRVYAGFWTNRGDCGDELAEVLASLADKDVFLFGTAGFGADETYFAGVMARVAVHLPGPHARQRSRPLRANRRGQARAGCAHASAHRELRRSGEPSR